MTPRTLASSQQPSSPRKRSKKPQVVALAILGAIALLAFAANLRGRLAQRAAHNLANPVAATPEVLAAAKSSYESHCASCHGVTGNGKGDKAQGLWTTPTDFQIAAQLGRRSDGDLYWITTNGKWPMPAFESKLSDLERWQLVDYIRTLSATESTSATSGQPARPPLP
jgi:mono/diheme cytochrome c family protein